MTYPVEILPGDVDDGVMPDNVKQLADAVVGRRIVSVHATDKGGYWHDHRGLVLTLDNGRQVELADTDDCCAFTYLEAFLLNAEIIDHVITGVGTTDQYETWHIYADAGDVLKLTVGWSAGNPFYYGYGFDITVKELEGDDR